MNKIYSQFSLYSNEFSLHQVNNLLKRESQFEGFKKKVFKINPSLSDYAEIALRKISQTIQDDQFIHGLLGKHYERGYGTLVSTDKRLMFIDAGDYQGFVFKETIPLENISSIDFSSSDNTIVITTAKKNIKIEAEEYGPSFCEAVHQLMNCSGKMDIPDISVILDLVERLGALRQSNILTDEEFSQEKAKLFSKI
ncbi:PH domain-containing protein [Chryseobacterium sp.]|uniref:PH domain-containing protein n=1 Tax=Chryseobacterium sp. TaxID=1871047 RepID=UPI00321BB005